MDLSKSALRGPIAVIAPEAALRRTVRLARVEASDRSPGARAEARGAPGQARAAADVRDVDALRREMERRALLPGPPPAFELTLLELERDLRQLLARIETTRARDSAAQALQPMPAAGPAEAADDALSAAPEPDTPR